MLYKQNEIFMTIRKCHISGSCLTSFFKFYVYLLSSFFLACQNFFKYLFVCFVLFLSIFWFLSFVVVVVVFSKKFSVNHKSR